MTEPVSHTAEARKFLFFKDSRPLGPTIDDKINAAVQEIIHGVSMGFWSVFQFCLPISMIASFRDSPLFDFLSVLLVVVFILAVIGMLTANSKIGPRPYQSGIPRHRTYVSDALGVGMVAVVGCAFALVFDLWRPNGPLSEQNDASNLALLASAFLMLLWSLRSIQERIQWVLDLRAEQGHMLARGTERDEIDPNAEPAWYQRPAK
ncbi:MAG: hypothetical protein CFE27_05450 [Alphaproteobacteria bacterium PA1]|nr:MAG: hypothetical protein CFE27_05450 [Alphaproteobacteria bacterium PA1]